MIILQLDSKQLTHLIQNSVRKAIKESQSDEKEAPEEILTVDQAANFLSLAPPTIYSLVSRGELPYMKRSKRIYFSRIELMEYLKEGRKKTNAEIEAEAESYLSNTKKGLNNGKLL